MKRLLVTLLIGAGLFGWQGGMAEAANNANQSKQTYNYQINVSQSPYAAYLQKWCGFIFKDSKTYVPVEQQKPNKEQEEKQPEKVVEKQPEQPVKQPEKQPAPAPAPQQQQPEQQQQPQQQANEQANNGLTAEEQQMLNLVNAERQKAGLQPLVANLELTKVARVKAQDMITNNYFSHQSPTYGSPFDMMRQFGISYQTAGENLAGNQTVERAHTALMNSDGHRANILSQNYKEVGIGIVAGGQYGKMFVQLFKG